ncbi:polyphosphate kinase 1 [Croceitalea rosinachiae]|uniref:Polyphosphate kinase n=1 Tax=Croceitalea rosinachiae TaxID=3075596 RepID=A0ABU3ABU8_9FLAO|nr:polyphosphate kinase 1 [Croceitalea sp. F388]MDT0607643.1 polyphosphate kinase 1 [Croceitalea sp. F388]
MQNRKLKNRDVNWLYFNERVLLEAANKTTPLLERLKFLAIFSSNLDEFFKVRISQLRQLKAVDKELRKKLVLKANKKLKFILAKVSEQQTQFGKIIEETLTELRQHDTYIRKRSELNQEQLDFLDSFFDTSILVHCKTIDIVSPADLKDGHLYLVVHIKSDDFDVIEIPTKQCSRFIQIPGAGSNYIFLDDAIRLNIHKIISGKTVINSYAIKLSRDAELYLEDDYTDAALVEKIYQSLGKRKSGQPTRLLYDMNMPTELQDALKKQLDISDVDMFLGGGYHNMSDFFGFPTPENSTVLQYMSKPPLKHPTLSLTKNIFKVIAEKDQLVHFPYQEFETVERFINEAASDDTVSSIKMSLYRIAKTSKLTDSILKALENGKKVLLFVEAQARFDEENNIKWGRIFEEKGATVLFSVPNIKVHSKIALVARLIDNKVERYAYIGTGNFNAKTAKLYCDHGLFTAHHKITEELSQVFDILERKLIIPKLKYLLVSPFTTRSTFLELIKNEIDNAKRNKQAKITLKMNSLEDSKMIAALYEASEAGVEIRLLVRGFCCLIPKKESELLPGEKPIYITSIVDRFLEHGRIYVFENGGEELMYIGSADWMTRNLDKRIEVLTPILDKDIFKELKDILEIQLADNVKARILDIEDSNTRVKKEPNENSIRSQYAIYDYLKDRLHEKS